MKNRYTLLLAAALLAPVAPTVLAASDAAGSESRKESRRAPTEDEALALAALEGLMSVSPDRALPILKRVLAGNQSNLVKARALFVASQIGAAEAQALLVDFARRPGPLRGEAIRNIGIGGQPVAIAALKELYAGGDEAVQREVLQAWLIADRRAEVFEVASAAKTDAEFDRALRTLSAMGAREELRKLATGRKNSKSLLEAFAVAGDLQSLKRIAETAGDPATRAEAVRRMGIISSPEAKLALRETYRGATDAQVKSAALDGLLIAGDQNLVLDLYKSARTPEEKRALLRTLGMMGGDAALAAIDEALGERK